MTPRLRPSLTLSLAATLLASSALAAGSHSSRKPRPAPAPAPARASAAAGLGAAAPDFRLLDHQGRVFRLSDHAGKIVVLEWTNPGCPYVKRHYEAGTMKSLATKWAPQDVVWVAINSTHTMDRVGNAAFADQHQLPYPVLGDPSGRVGTAFGARTTPHLVILAADGTVAYSGAIDDDKQGEKETPVNYVDQALGELTAGKPVSLPQTKPYGCSVKYPQ